MRTWLNFSEQTDRLHYINSFLIGLYKALVGIYLYSHMSIHWSLLSTNNTLLPSCIEGICSKRWGEDLDHKGYCHSHASLPSCLSKASHELNTSHTGSTKPKQTLVSHKSLFLYLSSRIDMLNEGKPKYTEQAFGESSFKLPLIPKEHQGQTCLLVNNCVW